VPVAILQLQFLAYRARGINLVLCVRRFLLYGDVAALSSRHCPVVTTT
jgi:hypothetical protein